MLRASTRRLRREESGQALVEFALVVPLLLVILLGIIEFGRAINYWIDTTHLANQAARFAAVDKNPGGGTLAQFIAGQGTTRELREGGTDSVQDGLSVELCFPSGTSKVGDPVRAVVSTKYKWLPFLDLPATTTTLRGSATMRIEVPPSAYAGSATCPA